MSDWPPPDTWESWVEYHRCVRCLSERCAMRSVGMRLRMGDCSCGGVMQRDWILGSTNIARKIRALR